MNAIIKFFAALRRPVSVSRVLGQFNKAVQKLEKVREANLQYIERAVEKQRVTQEKAERKIQKLDGVKTVHAAEAEQAEKVLGNLKTLLGH